MQICEIITDETLRETKEHGTIEFPFEYYLDDIKTFGNQCIEWHWHNEFEFVWIESGMVDCLIGNERIPMQEGDGMFINSGVIHRFEATGQGLIPNILFAPEFIAAKHTAIYHRYVTPVLASDCSYILFQQTTKWHRSIFYMLESIYTTAQSHHSMRELQIQTSVCTLWGELFSNIMGSLSARKDSGNARFQSRLPFMMEFIQKHYKERITLKDIADAAAVSKSEALRCFHAGVQTTPIDYLIKYRLNRAKDLLLSTQNSISEIALTVGFDHVGHFGKTFKKAFGVTPKAFREANHC